MQLTSPIVFFLPLSCWVWNVESQNDIFIISVANGGYRGDWGETKYCPTGGAKGFSLKVQPKQGHLADDSSLNGIRLICTDDSIINSKVGTHGTWSDAILCPSGILTSFSLRVSPQVFFGDDKGATNIKFMCTDGSEVEGNGHSWGTYGKWSNSCEEAGICGVQTKVDQTKRLGLDNSGLNDVKFFCCPSITAAA